MASQGSVIARVYTSDAYLPLAGAPVVFSQTSTDGTQKLIAVRMTNSSGLTTPVFLDTPEPSRSLTPGGDLRPYALVDIRVSYPGYSSIRALGVQVFPGVETIQGLQLRPVSPSDLSETTTYPETNQDL